jgi:hypothetical protein
MFFRLLFFRLYWYSYSVTIVDRLCLNITLFRIVSYFKLSVFIKLLQIIIFILFSLQQTLV